MRKRENAASREKALACRSGAILQDSLAAFQKFPENCDIRINRRTMRLEPVIPGQEYFDFSKGGK